MANISNPIVTRFHTNAAGFWRSYHRLILVFLVALLCDAWSTTRIMTTEGTSDEIHPVVRFLSSPEIFGLVLGPLVAMILKAMFGITIAIYCRRFAVHILLASIIISLWAAWYNVCGRDLYYPRLLHWLSW